MKDGRILWTLEQLRTFIEVVHHGSFTRAAEVLSLSQPAVSVQMRSLEQAVGVPLLERRPRRVLLTDAGRVLLQYARRMTLLESECYTEIADLDKLQGGLLRVGAGATPSIFTLAGVFAEYYRRWPKVELQVQIGRTSELVSSVLNDSLDLAIISSEIQSDGLRCMPIYTEPCVAIASVRHPIARQRSIAARQLVQHPMILLPAESGFRRFLIASLAEQGLQLQAGMELASLEAIKEVVSNGALASIVPQTAVSKDDTGLKVVPITGINLTRSTEVMLRQEKYLTAAMRAFFELLEERWPGFLS